MSAKYESIQRTVALALDQFGKSDGDQDQFYLLAWRGLEKLHYNISAEPKTLRIPVNGNQTAYLPPDYVSWVKIGIMNQNGEINTLRVNRALTKYNDNNPNRIQSLTPDIVDGWFNNASAPYVNYFNNGFYQPLYGVGTAGIVTYGSCTVDETNNLIVFEPNFKYHSVLFEYISCPQKDSDYLIDVRLREAIIAFIAWKLKLGTRQEFYGEVIEARRTIKPVNFQSFEQTIRLNEKMTITI